MTSAAPATVVRSLRLRVPLPLPLPLLVCLPLPLLAPLAAAGQPAAPPAAAGDPAAAPLPVEEEVVEVVAPAPAAPEPALPEAEASSAFVAVLQPGERGAAGRDLASLLGQAVGVRSSSLGGLDTYGTLSLRGSSGSQVLVLLDGVPLNSAATGSADLAGLPLEGLERIEVYRGQVPALLGGQAIGGAVHLVSRTPDRPGGVSSVRAGHGSFGTWDAALGHAGGTARLRYRLSLSLRRTEGDFPYHDDNGTPLTSADDRVAQRRNNDVSRLGLLGRLAWRMGGWNLAAFADGGYREAGVPGTGSNQAGSARLESERALLDLAGSRQGTVDVQGRSYVLLQRERFADPHGELQRPGAAPSSSESLSFTGGGRLSAGFDLPATRVELGGELRQEVLSSAADSEAEAALAASTAAGWEGEHSRLSAALGLEPLVAAWGGLLRFGPALRLEHLRSRSSAGGDGEAGETLVSPRFGLQLGTGLWKVKANAGRYHRAPTFSELFGGQGTMWGNPELLAEEGDNLDLGATLELGLPGPLGPPGMLGVEAVVFRRQVRQMIVWMQTSQEMIQAANLGEARLIGAELSLQAGLPWGFGWRSAYSWLDPENLSPEPAYHGKQLPLRPVHDLDLGLSWSTAPAEPGQALLSCEYRVTVVSGSYLDPANLHPLPLRHLHSATLWVRPWRRNGPQLLVEGTNLLDRRVEQLTLTHRGPGDPAQVAAPVVDFIGYPLPGRSLFASLLWSLEEQR